MSDGTRQGESSINSVMRRDGPDGRRQVKSFIRRQGRITVAQQRALDTLLPEKALHVEEGLLDRQAVFTRTAPLVLEIGFGMGQSLVELAVQHPDWDLIGVEVYQAGIGSLLHQAEQAGLDNVRVYAADGVEVLERCMAPASLHRVQLFFPDPWPKKRHHKRRLVQPPFVELVASRLAPGGEFLLATDWEPYAEQMLEVLSACPLLGNAAPGGGFVERAPGRGATRFERRGERLGHAIRDLAFRRLEEPA